jgi:hypothetical protein
MPPETDDNPFARNSVWPKMPQTPFRVGALPKAAPAPAPEIPTEPPPEPARTITPLYVRPAQGRGQGLAGGGAVLRPALQPRAPQPEAPPPALEPALPLEPPPAAEMLAAAPATAPEPGYVELEPVIVTPYATPRRPARRRRSPLPAVAATIVGLGGIVGLVYVLSQGRPAVPAAPGSTPAAVAVPAQPASTPAAEPAAAPKPAAAPRIASAFRSPSIRAARPAVAASPAEAAAAPEEASAPVLALPPAAAPPQAAAPEPEPQPAYTPRPAPDPNAPIPTRRPYS